MHFRYSNRFYCQLIYEYTGVFPIRVSYAEDNSKYCFYFEKESIKAIELQLERISKKVCELEKADTYWNAKESCLTLAF